MISTEEAFTTINNYLKSNQVLTQESKDKLTAFSKCGVVSRRALLEMISLFGENDNWLLILNSELEEFDSSNIHEFAYNLYDLCVSYRYDQEKVSL
jgi:hypothetical protein